MGNATNSIIGFIYFRLCSEFEECPPLPFPLRLLDVYMGYEDHCKQINSFPLSKDYVAKVLVKVFPGATRRFQYLNNQKYASYVGIRRCEVSEKGLPEPADMTTEGCLSVPTIFKIDQKPVKVEFNVKDGMSIVAGGEKRLVDLSLIDMPSNIQITNQEKALFQIGKEIRLCRGFISKTRSPEERYWSNLLTKEEELRISSHSCQAVIPWLSSSDICAPCRTFQKRQVTVSKPRQPDIVPESQDEALLQAVLERLPRDENAEAGKLGKLLKSQLRNTNLSDPRARRWTPEIIQLCLTIYCR